MKNTEENTVILGKQDFFMTLGKHILATEIRKHRNSMKYNEKIIIVYQTIQSALSIPNSWECRDKSQYLFMDPRTLL